MAFETYSTGGQQLKGLAQSLYSFGFYDVVLPALLIFAIFFGILQQVKLFSGKKKIKVKNAQGVEEEKEVQVGDKKINGLIAIVIALAVTLPHALGRYPVNFDPVIIISKLLPGAAMMFAAILSLILILGIGIKDAGKISAFQALVAMVASGVLMLIFVIEIFPGFIPSLAFLRDPAIQAALVVIATIVVVVYFIMRTESTEKLPVKVHRWMTEKVP